jgi:hypothetical protein
MFFNDPQLEGGAAKSIAEQIEALKGAIKANIAALSASDAFTAYKNIEKTAISIADSSKTLQRSMGGVVMDSSKFASKLIESYKNTVKIGAEFKDITGTVQGLAESMQRMVDPSLQTIENMVALSQATGMGAGEVGKMVGELTRFGGTQLQATEKMHDLAVEARKVGIDSKKFLTDVNANMKSLNGFGFGNSVKGLTDMVKQATLLRTSIEKIGASALQSKILDPEGAMETAASFQMLGGAVGKLADPFQLMRMAQSDMKGLQDEIIKSSASAFKFNSETGKFDTSVADMYRLREQATLMGKSLDEVMEVGREAAKANFLKDRFGFADLDEDELNLVTGLTEIGPDGKVTIDIPGYGEIEEANLGSAEAQQALNDYMQKAGKDEKDIAINNLTVAENQAKDVNIIKSAILTQMGVQDRATFLKDLETANKKLGDTITDGSTTTAKNLEGTIRATATAEKNAANLLPDPLIDPEAEQKMIDNIEKVKNKIGEPTQVNDMLFKPGDAPQLMAEGTLYKGIVGDEVAIGTNLTNALNKGAGSIGGNVGGNIGGNIDININLNGSIAGDPGQLNKMFNSPEVQKQIMDTVLYKMNEYKRQQGVLS